MKKTTLGNPLLGASIRRAREAAELKKRQIAGIDPAYLFRIEKGEKTPSREMLLRIADGIGANDETREKWLHQAGYAQPSSTADAKAPDVQPTAPELLLATPVDRTLATIATKIRWLTQREAQMLEQKLAGVIEHVVKHWADGPNTPAVARLIADHGPEHNARMVAVLCDNFERELRVLDASELWLLLAAFWLQDIGLSLLPDPKDGDLFAERLKTYEVLSVDHVRKHQSKLGLSDAETRVLANLCQHHRNRDRLRDVVIGETGGEMPADRQKLALALLRLVSMMEVHQDRVVRPDRVTNLLPFKNPIPADLESELIRNLFLVTIYRQGHTLCAEVCYSRDFEQEMVFKLKERLQEELQGSLDLVSDSLVLYAKSVLLWTKLEIGPAPEPGVLEHLTHAVKVLLSSHSPNAALVIDSLIGLLEKHLDTDTIVMTTVASEVRSELAQFTSMRSYHAQIANISEEIDAVLNNQRLDEREKTHEMREIVQKYKDSKQKAYGVIRTEGAELLRQGAHRDIFLFGLSQSVLEALQGFKTLHEALSLDTCVHLFECRSKSDHGPYGKLVYCDGVEYARQITRLGYKTVTVWPDGTVYRALRDSKAAGRKPVVLLGAEGIEAEREPGDVLSTVGTMPVILAAEHLMEIPIFVFTEGGKLRAGLEEKGERQNRWLFSEEKQAELELGDIIVRNAITERVPSTLIKGILSEHGLRSPQQFVEAVIKSRRLEPHLRARVDEARKPRDTPNARTEASADG